MKEKALKSLHQKKPKDKKKKHYSTPRLTRHGSLRKLTSENGPLDGGDTFSLTS
jgi:hypothetical protein